MVNRTLTKFFESILPSGLECDITFFLSEKREEYPDKDIIVTAVAYCIEPGKDSTPGTSGPTLYRCALFYSIQDPKSR